MDRRLQKSAWEKEKKRANIADVRGSIIQFWRQIIPPSSGSPFDRSLGLKLLPDNSSTWNRVPRCALRLRSNASSPCRVEKKVGDFVSLTELTALLKPARRRVTNLPLANQAGRRRQSLEYLRARNTREFRYSRENRLTLRWNWTDHPYPGYCVYIRKRGFQLAILYWSRIVDTEISLSPLPPIGFFFFIDVNHPSRSYHHRPHDSRRPNSNRLSSFAISQQDSVGEFLRKDPPIFYRSKESSFFIARHMCSRRWYNATLQQVWLFFDHLSFHTLPFFRDYREVSICWPPFALRDFWGGDENDISLHLQRSKILELNNLKILKNGRFVRF